MPGRTTAVTRVPFKGSVEERLSAVEERMDAYDTAHGDMRNLMQRMSDALGEPQVGAVAATGIYAFIDAVSTRLTWFERMRERGIGMLVTSGVLLPPGVALLWWLAGDKITKIFH